MKKLIIILFLFFSQRSYGQYVLDNYSFESFIPQLRFSIIRAPYLPCSYWKFVTAGIPNYYYFDYGCYCDSISYNYYGVSAPIGGIIKVSSDGTLDKKYGKPSLNTNPVIEVFLDQTGMGNLQVIDLYNRKLSSITYGLYTRYIAFKNGEYDKGIYIIKVSVPGTAGERFKLVVQ